MKKMEKCNIGSEKDKSETKRYLIKIHTLNWKNKMQQRNKEK